MMSEKMYGVYDIKDDYVCVGMFDTIAELANFLGIKPNHASSIISKKKRHKYRYVIEKIDMQEENETYKSIL